MTNILNYPSFFASCSAYLCSLQELCDFRIPASLATETFDDHPIIRITHPASSAVKSDTPVSERHTAGHPPPAPPAVHRNHSTFAYPSLFICLLVCSTLLHSSLTTTNLKVSSHMTCLFHLKQLSTELKRPSTQSLTRFAHTQQGD